MPSLLAYRRYAGIGDWLMMMTVLKMVNQQRPDIDIYLNMKAKNAQKHRNIAKDLPKIAEEMIRGVDVKIKDFACYDEPTNHVMDYDLKSGFMTYHKADGIGFIESMVNKLNRNSGLNIRYDPNVYAQYQDDYLAPDTEEKFVLVQSCSKKRNRDKSWKDFGFNNMQVIVDSIKNKVKVFQIGVHVDFLLKGVHERFLSVTMGKLHNLMKNCVAFIGLDGFLGVYAAHHGVKQYIIYSGRFNLAWTAFPCRTQINGKAYNADQVGGFLSKELSSYA